MGNYLKTLLEMTKTYFTALIITVALASCHSSKQVQQLQKKGLIIPIIFPNL
jgi:hypothetical protein